MTQNFLTFDIEEWYNANFNSLDSSQFENKASNLESNVDTLIDICAEYNVKSTCFVLGKLAETKPQIIKKLHNAGHEIACHSYNHKLIYEMTSNEFDKDLKKANSLLENLIGEKVIGFRAPSWSVNEKILEWFYDVLGENGIKYSSSVYPAKTYLYGLPNFPSKIHFPVVNGITKSVIEIPQSLINVLGKTIGFSGGFFLRVFPAWFINKNISKLNKKGNSVFIYLHPHEIDNNLPKANMSKKESLIFYWNIKNTEKKIRALLEQPAYSFTNFSRNIAPERVIPSKI
ncbi:MAG: polysaccharide deacetylase family protein [Saprospiraceae bacterium]|nr:polysaccharide deacetylase family protein [Saprospiraceae bacterium]